MVLLDTDVLIDFQRNFPPAAKWFLSLTEIPSVPGLVVMELIQDARNRTELERSLKLIVALQIVWPTEQECKNALDLFARYHLSHRLGLIDAFIAAMAMKRQAQLCTFNIKHYRNIPGLNWQIPYAKK